MYNTELLSAIDNIDDVVYEAETNVLESLLESYNKASMILENYQGDNFGSFDVLNDIYIQESDMSNTSNSQSSDTSQSSNSTTATTTNTSTNTTSTKKDNIFKIIWKRIVALLKWIGNQFKRLGNWIKSIFTKNKKSADQLCEECNIKPNTSSPTTQNQFKNKRKVYKINNQKIAVPLKQAPMTINSLDSKNKPNPRVFENDELLLNEVDALTVSFNNNEIIFKYTNIEQGIHDIINYDYIKNQNAIPNQRVVGNNIAYVKTMMVYFSDNKYINNLQNVVHTLVQDIKTNKETMTLNDMDKATNMRLADYDIDHMTMTYPELLRVNTGFVKIFDEFSSIDISSLSSKHINDLNTKIESLYLYISFCQYGLNAIMGALHECYLINVKYCNTVSDVQTLSAFANKCIQSGMPPKYVMANTTMIATIELKGSRGFVSSPHWGQSRFVLIPDDGDIVYKIALNGQGHLSNKTEMMVSSMVKKDAKIKDYLATSFNSYTNYSIITMQKTDVTQSIDTNEQNKIVDIVQDEMKLNKNFNFYVEDLHEANWGVTSDGKPVIIDYGNIQYNK